MLHPRRLVDALGKGCLQVVHKGQHALLAALGEVLLHIELAYRLAHHVAHDAHRTLPAGTVFLDACEHLTELEVSVPEVIAQQAYRSSQRLCLRISLQVVERRVLQYALHLLHRLRLSEIHLIERRESLCEENVAPVYSRIVGDERGVAHLVIVGVDVAQLHLVVAGFRYACLYGEEHISFLLSRLRIVTGKAEERGDVFLVCLAHLNGLLVVVEIVVAVAQTYAALRYSHDVLRGVALVGSHTDAEHHGSHALAVEPCRDELILFLVLYSPYLLEHRHKRSRSITVEPHAVHQHVVQVAYLLSERTFGLAGGRVLLYQSADALLVLFLKVDESTV